MGSSLSFFLLVMMMFHWRDWSKSYKIIKQMMYITLEGQFSALCLFMMFVILPIYLCCLLGFLLFATEGSYNHTVARHSIEELHQGC